MNCLPYCYYSACLSNKWYEITLADSSTPTSCAVQLLCTCIYMYMKNTVMVGPDKPGIPGQWLFRAVSSYQQGMRATYLAHHPASKVNNNAPTPCYQIHQPLHVYMYIYIVYSCTVLSGSVEFQCEKCHPSSSLPKLWKKRANTCVFVFVVSIVLC